MADSSILTISTPAAGGSFHVLGLKGREQMNRLSEFKVDVVGEVINLIVADQAKPINVDLLLGNEAEVKFELREDKRFFSGHITHFAQGERYGRFRRYEITLRPWLWFSTRTRNSRTFQKKSVKDIVDEVLQPYNGKKKWNTSAVYPKLDYCVQYDETDFDFVSRLLQRAGINYFFEYTEGAHTLVLIDSNAKFEKKPNSDPVSWGNAFNTSNPTMCDWRHNKEVRSVKAVVHDHDYLATAKKIEGTKTVTVIPPNFPIKKLGESEVFEYPGDVVNNSQLDANDAQAATRSSDRAKVLLESLTSLQAVCTGRTNTRDIAVGTVFTLKDHPEEGPLNDQNGDYIVVSASLSVAFDSYESEDLKSIPREREGFLADIACVKKGGNAIRPEVTTRKPMMRGPQTAIVVGASGNEIETDKHGRIKIQFFWDREGKKDQNSSCWVRVAMPWASKNFGMISLPRVGDEVLVDFIDGDPDRPIVVGSVYNDVNPPIWTLPDNATMSGVKTRTSKGGSDATANELRFEDKKDGEYIWFQAEKDFYRYVKRHAWDWIAENETRKTKKIRKEVIGETWNMDVGKDVMHNFGKDLHVTVAGDILYKGGGAWHVKLAQDLTLEAGGNFGYTVKGKTAFKSTGDLSLTTDGEAHIKAMPKIVLDGMEIQLKAKTGLVFECPGGIILKCGGSLVSVTPGGVDIVGPMVKINSGGGGPSAGSAKAAAPAKPAEAKKLEDITSGKASDYDKTFEDPLKKK